MVDGWWYFTYMLEVQLRIIVLLAFPALPVIFCTLILINSVEICFREYHFHFCHRGIIHYLTIYFWNDFLFLNYMTNYIINEVMRIWNHFDFQISAVRNRCKSEYIPQSFCLDKIHGRALRFFRFLLSVYGSFCYHRSLLTISPVNQSYISSTYITITIIIY